MRYIPINKIVPGMVLGNDLYDSWGRLLVSKNFILTDVFIEKIREKGIFGLYIDDDISKGIEIESAISPALRAEGMSAVQTQDIDACKNIAKRIVEEMVANQKVSLDMFDLKTFDDYLFSHCVNVAVIGCTIGMGMRFGEKLLEDIVLSGLLHDLGKMEIPDEILNKPERLTNEEFALIKTHANLSYEMIKDRPDISANVKHAVLSHHENYDGSGYPNGLDDNNISPIARILHVADVYDALTSKRCYKKPYSQGAAIDLIEGGKGTTFDPGAVEAFIGLVPLYPKGTTVIIGESAEAIIVENSGVHNKRPIVRTRDFREIDLSLPENIEISIRVSDEINYFEFIESEHKREEMIKPVKRKRIMVLDYSGQTFLYLNKELNYLYDFQHARSDNLATGYIRKYGYPDMIIVDVDGRDLSVQDYIKDMNTKMTSHVPVLVLGSYKDIETIQMFRSLGIMNYVLKPINITYIQNELRRQFNEHMRIDQPM